MNDIIEVHLWSKKRSKYGRGLLINSMPSPHYNAEENAKSLAELIIDTTPGDTLDLLIAAIANKMRDIIQNKYAKDQLLNPFYIEDHITTSIIELADNNLPNGK